MTLRGWLGLTLLPGVYAALDAERARSLELRLERDKARTALEQEVAAARQREQTLLEQFAQERAELLNRFVGRPPDESRGEKDARQRVGPSRVLSPLQRQMKAGFEKYQQQLRIAQEQVEPAPAVEEEAIQIGEEYLRHKAVNGAE